MDPGTASLLIAGGAVSSASSFGFGQAAAGKSWDKWKDSQTRGPTYRLIGLNKAGLNPILAAKNSLGGAGGSSPYPFAPGQGTGNPGLDLVQGANASAQTTAAKAQARKLGAEADMAEQLRDYYKDNPKVLADREVNASMPNNVTGAVTRGLFGGQNPLFTPEALRDYIREMYLTPGGPAKRLWNTVKPGLSSAKEAAADALKSIPTEGPRDKKTGQPRSGRKRTRNRERKK